MKHYKVIVIGGGPAGLSAALSAHKNGASTLLIEREARLGGILKQCIHDGFGLVRFGEKLSGPEYAERFMEEFYENGIDCLLSSFVTHIEKKEGKFFVSLSNSSGMSHFTAEALVLATGCRERTAKQVSIHGTRPAGVFTAGTAQNFTNLMGLKPTRRCVILGSGDIGLIMARRLTLEGSRVLGVYEAKSSPSGLTRNIHQCLYDYDIPLFLSHTVTRCFGEERLSAVEISKVDENMRPVDGTRQIIDCDALILSVGLIPENELAEGLGVQTDARTKGPVCDADLMSGVDGVFSCGNALHVNDLADYVSESGEIAGRAAAAYRAEKRELVKIEAGKNLLYLVPQMLNLNSDNSEVTLYFRSSKILDGAFFKIYLDGEEIFSKKYMFLRPPEMERLVFNFSKYSVASGSKIEAVIEEATK